MLSLAGCTSTDHVVFVTSTNIGIGADPATYSASIGYGRDELIVGPAYVDTGAMPPVFGSLKSNLSIFSPDVSQVYATGKAAQIVNDKNSTTPGSPPKLNGKRRPMFFGTTSKVGLHVTFASELPTVDFGYRRRELSIIPLQPSDLPADSSKEDGYASTIASISLSTTTESLKRTGIDLRQFFATGAAADAVASDPDIKALFQQEAKNAVTDNTIAGIKQSETRKLQIAAIVSCASKNNNFQTDFGTMVDSTNIDASFKSLLKQKTKPDDAKEVLTNTLQTAVDPLYQATQKSCP
jgi:hypothetical protein